jgi:hypothetical protein
VTRAFLMDYRGQLMKIRGSFTGALMRVVENFC